MCYKLVWSFLNIRIRISVGIIRSRVRLFCLCAFLGGRRYLDVNVFKWFKRFCEWERVRAGRRLLQSFQDAIQEIYGFFFKGICWKFFKKLFYFVILGGFLKVKYLISFERAYKGVVRVFVFRVFFFIFFAELFIYQVLKK